MDSLVKRILVSFALLLLMNAPLYAHTLAVGDLVVYPTWAIGGSSEGDKLPVYVEIQNTGSEQDQLVSAEFEGGGSVELHQAVRVGNTISDRKVKLIPVPPGESVALQPGGYHLAVRDLGQSAEPGDMIPGRLQFSFAGDVPVEVSVERPGASGPSEE